MDETRIDDRTDASARFGDVPSSPTRSPLHLASLSSEPLGSPYTDGSPNTAAAGLGTHTLAAEGRMHLWLKASYTSS